jgi:hypothetical protein
MMKPIVASLALLGSLTAADARNTGSWQCGKTYVYWDVAYRDLPDGSRTTEKSLEITFRNPPEKFTFKVGELGPYGKCRPCAHLNGKVCRDTTNE